MMEPRLRSAAPATLARLLVLGLLAAGAGVRAEPLSIEDCVRMAVERNRRLVSAAESAREAGDRVLEARSRRRPTASLRGGAAYAPIDGLDPALTNGGEYAGLLEVRQTLYDGGAIGLGRQQSEVWLRQARTATSRTAADVRLDVRLAYVDRVGADRRYRLMQESRRDLESYLETVRSLADGGAVPRTDVLKVELQLQSEAAAFEDLGAAVESATQRLLESINLPADTTVAVRDSVALPVPPERFVVLANGDLEAAALGVEAAALDARLAAAERHPIVTFLGSVGGWTSRTQLLDPGSPHVLGYQAGIALELPVWNWGATRARIGQKEAAQAALRADYEVLRRHLEAEYAANAARLRSAARVLVLLKQSRAKAFEQYDLAVARYAGGGASSLEVLDAHRSLLGVALQEVEVESNSESLRAQMLRATGEPQ